MCAHLIKIYIFFMGEGKISFLFRLEDLAWTCKKWHENPVWKQFVNSMMILTSWTLSSQVNCASDQIYCVRPVYVLCDIRIPQVPLHD